jgi:hypothetical protein
VFVYSKDHPDRRWQSDPSAIAFENYYYTQPLPDGGKDNNRLENFFSTIEQNWTPLVKKIKRREPIEEYYGELFEFVAMHRVRVPTARDAAERMRAEQVRMTYQMLEQRGEFPALPTGFDPELFAAKNLQISIDPHQSIHAMPHMATALAQVFDMVGFEILENDTELEIVTSDNPLVYFDPTHAESDVQPYRLSQTHKQAEIMFPITPKHLLWGHSERKLLSQSVPYNRINDVNFVRRVNRFMARFANRFIFTQSDKHLELIKRHAVYSPIVQTAHVETAKGRAIIVQSVFGKRTPKPKWKGGDDSK